MDAIILGIILLLLLIGFCMLNKKTHNLKEGLGGGGLSTVTALDWYNRQDHCWKGQDGGTYCGTNSALML